MKINQNPLCGNQGFLKITALVENTSNTSLIPKHGLSFYIETKSHKILFDLGPDSTFLAHAKALRIDLSAVDTVIVSHGHYDHGGGLKDFLEINSSAKIYVQRSAFQPHFSKTSLSFVPIGIDRSLTANGQVVLLDGDCVIDDELSLFTVDKTEKCHSPANDVLFENRETDSFAHEQNLLISAEKTALIMGCGHAGVVNIMEKAGKYRPCLCVGGFHLFNPITNQTAPEALLDEIALYLRKQENTVFYTCHCTGTKAYDYLSQRVDNLHYISCGETLEI